MLVSICGAQNSTKGHIVHWTNISGLDPQQTTNNLYSIPRDSRRYKTRLRIQLQWDGSWNSIGGAAERTGAHKGVPKLTLARWLLNARKDRGTTRAPPPKLTKKDILHVAMRIAKSLLFLIDSPLLQGPWNTETIYVADTAEGSPDNGLRVKPYIPRKLTDILGEEDSTHCERARSSVLHLGLPLWELFFDSKIQVNEADQEDDEDDDSDDSWYNALHREELDLREPLTFIDPLFLAIVGNCLDLYPKADVIDKAFRTDLYWNIVKPSAESRESYDSTRSNLALTMERGIATPLSPPSWRNTGFDQSHALETKLHLLEKTAKLEATTSGPVLHQSYIFQSQATSTNAALLGSQGKVCRGHTLTPRAHR